MQGDNVRLRKERLQIDILHAQLQRSGAGIRIKRQQAHAKSFKNAKGGHADFAGANDACGFTVHGKPRQPLQREVGITGTLIGTVNTTVERHHHPDGMFCHGFRRIGRDANDLQTQLFGGIKIDVVKTRAAQGNVFHALFFQLFQHRSAAVVVNENTDTFAAVGSLRRLFSQQKVEKFKIETVRLVNMLQILFVVLLCAIYREFHKTFSSDFGTTLACLKLSYNFSKFIEINKFYELL